MSDVPDEHPLLRLPTPPPHFVPDSYKPTWEVVAPSGKEKASTPVRISVWDETLTSPSEAAAFRANGGALLVLPAESTIAVKSAGATRVVYEPLPDPTQATWPGANGHASVEGLERANGEPRPAWKARLDRIAAVFELIDRLER